VSLYQREKSQASVSNRIELLSGNRKLNCKQYNNYIPWFFLALLFSYILLLKHVQIRQGLQRADALRICPDDLLIVEKYPGAPIVFRTNVRDVVARVDRRTLV
jgi:hypothetical protein